MKILALYASLFFLVGSNAQDLIPDRFIWRLQVEKSSGTCFFIHEDGYLLTAAHNFWNQQSDGGLIANWANKTYQIENKNGESLAVKIVDIKCNRFYKNYKICNNKNGIDIALLEVVNKTKLKSFKLDVPEILMRDSERLPLTNIFLYGYDPQDPIIKPVKIAQLNEVYQNTPGMSDFVLTKKSQWYTNDILYNRVKSGFSGAPILNFDKSNFEIVGLLTARYSNGKGFGEMSKNFSQIFKKIDLKQNIKIQSVIKKLNAGNVRRSDINPLTRLETFYLVNYLKKNQGKINDINICRSFFTIKNIKLIYPGFLESVLIEFLNNKTIGLACQPELAKKAELADFIYKNINQITNVETLEWGYNLYRQAEINEVEQFSNRRKLSFYDSFANAAIILGDRTKKAEYYKTSIQKSLKAGLIASELNKKQYRYAENVANAYYKVGDFENSLYFFENAYFERLNSDNNPHKIVDDIIYVKGRINNKIYTEASIGDLENKVRTLGPENWTKKINEIRY